MEIKIIKLNSTLQVVTVSDTLYWALKHLLNVYII